MGYYVLVFLFGLLGAGSMLRALEILFVGGGVRPVMFLVGGVFLYLAMVFLRKARGAS